MGDDPKPDDALDECLENVQQLKEQNDDLKEENQDLRESADAFGNLAERLTVKLRKHREAADKKPVPPNDPPSGK